MTGSRITKYSDKDRARVYLELVVNQGNVRRTARNTGVPEPTVRGWKRHWADEGPPPMDEVEEVATDFFTAAEKVRDEALSEMRKKIPHATPSALVAMVGMLTDKITIARGLATSRVEHTYELPSSEELRVLVQGFVQGAIEASKARRGEIIDAELVEQAPLALPAPPE